MKINSLKSASNTSLYALICYTSNAFFRLKRDICKALDREGDGHPQAWRWMVSGFDQMDPKLFMFGVCRRCFYTGELDDIEFRTSPRDPDAYRRQFPFEVLKGLSSRKDNPYNITKTLGQLAADETPIIGAIARFHLAIFSQCLREKIVPGQIARYYLRLAWLYRDQESYYAEADLEEVKRKFGVLAKVWRNYSAHKLCPYR